MKESLLKNIDLNDGLAVTKAMLKAYPMQYIGLIGLDGKPKVKAFEFKFEDEGILYFDTIKNKETHLELLNNPYVEISVADNETMDWIRISGKAEFVNDQRIKDKLFESSAILRKYYGDSSNPDVLPFCLREVVVHCSSLEKEIGYHEYHL
ncbi:MAG: pyridoxamine 5'-phosphate oxidase family protein [Erysipelotrichaceae bacterium]|nr:pyridoxamine 5'-phosphate oxidase family protein [Erysipelotrichaceae bacterium]